MGIRSTWRMKGRVRLTSKSLSTSHSKATPEPVTTREGTKKRERDRKKQGACDCFQTAHNTNSHARYVETWRHDVDQNLYGKGEVAILSGFFGFQFLTFKRQDHSFCTHFQP
ncbi:hypothetical protein TNIN_185551 [Trichonephila inaurata madagascariensis]|uniref:Uncharacterized protein n=1 Tax=Trichonephila inaurata madagascariensis TaxID=2747483 RepID=A0A8X7C036_9ARAC|nr:hypothetical protein TNIN_185551 [Trichonephila inaurata madagascariensis]